MEYRYPFTLSAYSESQIQLEASAKVPGCFGVCGGTDGVVFLYATPLTPAQLALLANVVKDHAPAAPTVAQKLDAKPAAAHIIAALVVRTSTQWASLTAARQAELQAMIDAEAATIAALL